MILFLSHDKILHVDKHSWNSVAALKSLSLSRLDM